MGHYAFCLQCLGGGKSLGVRSSKKRAESDATSHVKLYGHNVTILPVPGKGKK